MLQRAWSSMDPGQLQWGPPSHDLPRNTRLEHAIAHAPDDLHPLAVYADFLTSAGDSRGEVLAAWCQWQSAPDPELEQAMELWRCVHSRGVCVGPATEMATSTFRGPLPDAWNIMSMVRIPDVTRILASPRSVGLRRLSVDFAFRGDPTAIVEAVRGRPRPSPLRALRVSWNRGHDVRGWWSAFEGLDSVELEGNIGAMGEVVVPRLRALMVIAQGHRVRMDGLAGSALERLQIGAEAVPPETWNVDLPALRELALTCNARPDISSLLASSLASGLEELTLGPDDVTLHAVAGASEALPACYRSRPTRRRRSRPARPGTAWAA